MEQKCYGNLWIPMEATDTERGDQSQFTEWGKDLIVFD